MLPGQRHARQTARPISSTAIPAAPSTSAPRYITREMGYDTVPHVLSHLCPQSTAYLFALEESTPKGSAHHAIGAAFFPWEPTPLDPAYHPGPHYHLEWVWLHPYFRRHALLTKAWAWFQHNHGPFTISHPRSAAMQAFLE